MITQHNSFSILSMYVQRIFFYCSHHSWYNDIHPSSLVRNTLRVKGLDRKRVGDKWLYTLWVLQTWTRMTLAYWYHGINRGVELHSLTRFFFMFPHFILATCVLVGPFPGLGVQVGAMCIGLSFLTCVSLPFLEYLSLGLATYCKTLLGWVFY